MTAVPAPAATIRTIATEIDIARDIERVWAVLTDYADYVNWNPYLVRIEGEARAGTTIVVHALGDGAAAPVLQRIEVVGVAPYAMRWRAGAADRSELAFDHWFELEPAGPHDTVFKHYEHFSGSRLIEFGPQHEALVGANFLRFNEALKARCEGR